MKKSTPCSVDECERVAEKRGMCGMHYQRIRKNGTTDDPVERDIKTRIINKITVDMGVACWLWPTANRQGYGILSIDGRNNNAHRVSYEVFRGPVPRELVIDHLCRIKRCVNPFHLEPVTDTENIRRSPITLATINSKKIRCKRDHLFDEKNTYPIPGGGRGCRTCRNMYSDRYKAAKARRLESDAG